ncbi:uncharacterized protein LOC130996671 [Salvia miltiorrhiza]|uniref:uncharacterized protein LOC130996671 n=1 Tax=Salvia miltiorrhiza TaxID=226208 RepID=UPI0025AC88F1|nr:uncharacterized protein LOC130996671 [Salvia miltiorrhiza]
MEGFFWIPSLSGPTTVAARKTLAVVPLGFSSTLFKQREEEMRKAEEAATNGLQITNCKVNKEMTLLEGHTSSSNIDGFAVNGNEVNSELKDNERSSADREETPDKSDDEDGS